MERKEGTERLGRGGGTEGQREKEKPMRLKRSEHSVGSTRPRPLNNPEHWQNRIRVSEAAREVIIRGTQMVASSKFPGKCEAGFDSSSSCLPFFTLSLCKSHPVPSPLAAGLPARCYFHTVLAFLLPFSFLQLETPILQQIQVILEQITRLNNATELQDTCGKCTLYLNFTNLKQIQN